MKAITRPNGTSYRPRRLRTTILGNEDEGPTSIVVFGTSDLEEARSLAILDVGAYNAEWNHDSGRWLTLDESPVEKWYTRRLSHFDEDAPRYFYELDPEKGAFGLEFDLTETEVLHSPDDGSYDGITPATRFNLDHEPAGADS